MLAPPAETNKWPSALRSELLPGSIQCCVRASAAVEVIADWLDELGMSEYAQRFAENDIGTDVFRRTA